MTLLLLFVVMIASVRAQGGQTTIPLQTAQYNALIDFYTAIGTQTKKVAIFFFLSLIFV